MQPNTEEWQRWRHQGLGASDAASVLGISPYKTALDLYNEKLQKDPPKDEGGFIFQKGHKLEGVARALYEIDTMMEFPPLLCAHTDYTYLKCSMDGFNKEEKVGAEIKYVGKACYEEAKKTGKCPDTHKHFITQVHHQYIVTGAKKIDLVLYNDDHKRIVILEVKPTTKQLADLLAAEIEFWQNIQKKVPPAISSKDFKIVKGNKDFSEAAKKYKSGLVKSKKLEAELKVLKKTVLAFVDHDRVKCGGLTFLKVDRIGSIDYSKVPQLKDVDLELYRKAGSSSYKIEIVKPKASAAKAKA